MPTTGPPTPPPEMNCAYKACGAANASYACSACADAPHYNETLAPHPPYDCLPCAHAPKTSRAQPRYPAYDCGARCLEADLKKRQTDCSILASRKTLHRRLALIDIALLAFLEAAYRYKLGRVEEENGELIMYIEQVMDRSDPQPLPQGLEMEVKEAVLTYMACSHAPVLIYELLEELIEQGLVEEIEEIRVIALPTRKMKYVIDNFENSQPQAYVFDPTGRQYGFTQPLLTAAKFLRERCEDNKLHDSWSLGHKAEFHTGLIETFLKENTVEDGGPKYKRLNRRLEFPKRWLGTFEWENKGRTAVNKEWKKWFELQGMSPEKVAELPEQQFEEKKKELGTSILAEVGAIMRH
ncbi:hypothetical protein BU16DRAFT_543139 [Lophium mytilinum]|uniref:MYND-type zinc finger protein samB n=1 Tax=Lophium mytilinum TaxID=390894 RepID=A0A6A6QFR5_9PEZI|nr:hypothetical protein BU16DRAFT_543139 [Lophium mytilinum]